jgi:uncharacterized membrane protein YedE/YeeE
MELEITTQVLLWAFALAFIIGAVANKTNFCTMGAVSDWVNIGDTSRIRAWSLAIIVALIGVVLLEATATASVSDTLPPYRSANFSWLRHIVGGLIFGIGMVYTSGCGNKCLIRIGGGNIKSIFVVLVAGYFAYLMTKTAFYETLFHPWVTATTIDLSAYNIPSQDLGGIFSGIFGGEAEKLRTIIGGIIAVVALAIIFKSEDFRKSGDNIISGLTIGCAVVAAWYITGGPMGDTWKETAEFMDVVPVGVATQSYTFINPMGDTLYYALTPSDTSLISFGVAAFIGVITGSLVYSVVFRKFRFEWFADMKDFISHMIGAIMIGTGGVLAMGCTIGQGVTGVSTLALGSFITLIAIVFGAAITMKIQYYMAVYEDEASLVKALLSSLVDMKLLPASMRKLDAI